MALPTIAVFALVDPAAAQNVTPVTCLVSGSAGQNGINPNGASFTQNGTTATTSTNATVFLQSLGANGDSNALRGGSAGTVSITANGTIYSPGVFTPGTQGFGGLIIPESAAIWAQSIGGCGDANSSNAGHGGQAGDANVTVNQNAVIQLGPNVAGVYALSAGGQGGGYSHDSHHHSNGGGDAGNVTVVLAGSINNPSLPPASGLNTDNSYGIYALSVGGSSGATDNKYSDLGGNAGNVSVQLAPTARIHMEGENAIAIFAASAGGLSWYADNGVSNGHQNGDGGDVTVTVDKGAVITTNGELGVGILAVSTGGNANTSQHPPDSLENGGSPNSVPSDLAPPGNAGDVSVVNAGSISTQGDVAIGIVAASTTGGRGVGLLTENSNGTYEIDQVGQIGPGTGAPGTVTVQNSGSITTTGIGSSAILALSLGGAGGVMDSKPGLLNLLGGHTAGTGADGDTVKVVDSGTLTTQGAVAMGILAESIGGGGGTATGTSGVIAIGTNGGTGGNGGNVTVEKTRGKITTTGDGSFAILAHSIGGGGGNGGNSTGLVASVGGAGGASGDGGTVSVKLGEAGHATLNTSGDYAPGIGAQSIGGGGGNGGYAKSYALAAFSAAVGGSGGTGGKGGTVDVQALDSSVTTTGSHSPALLEQSIGGGGGSGGGASVYTVGVSLAVATAIGGDGAKGGEAGAVSLESSGSFTTTGLDSVGILAQSVGGGGGNGGSALSRSEAIAIPDLPSITLSTAVGGSGGSGGNGDVVDLRSDGTVSTSGDGSTGILAQSIGGGGGNGGDASAFSSAISADSPSLTVTTAIGGAGNGAGNGGQVVVVNGGNNCDELCAGHITTAGDNAAGILAQSIGGGGGNGSLGNGTTGSSDADEEESTVIKLGISLGGSGGVGGSGGSVNVINTPGSVIRTLGSGSQGILAQSIGGGGGNAGGGSLAGGGDSVTVHVTLGGAAGDGASGGTVLATNSGTIMTGQLVQQAGGSFTTGGDAVGILAQSIGGGGGTGGSSDPASSVKDASKIAPLLDDPSEGYTAHVDIGGTGGGSGDGGLAQSFNDGTVVTLGTRAYGVVAQSIGGGGGSGGAANASADARTGGSYSATIAIGGTGGGGGNGGEAIVNNPGSILTAGYGATGIIAQSIGGGGGIGAEGTVNNTTLIGIGGDWNGGGGSGGNGDIATVTATNVTTLGDDAPAILAQSIGGGGGAASAGCSNSASAKVSGISTTVCFGNQAGLSGDFSPWTDSSSFTLTVGGGAGTSGDGGDVTVEVDGAVTTFGARSMGVIAQSIGGGGGLVSAAAANTASATVQATPGANNGAAGDVSVTLATGSSITTHGDGGWGILAQSIAGGGGFAGDPSLPIQALAANVQTSSKTPGYTAGTVDITLAGNIVTTGANAHGIVAQSVGTGGGISNNSDNSGLLLGDGAQINGVAPGDHVTGGNTVTITQTSGVIQASGIGSIGILAQSTGVVTAANNGYAAPISVTLSGTVIGGTNTGYSGGIGAAGIVLSGGSNNDAEPSQMNQIQLNAGAALSTMDGVAGTAILARDGWTLVTNLGTITGSIDLGSSTGEIVNSGTLNAGAVLNAFSTTNSGILNVAGAGTIGTTTVTGWSGQAFTQMAGAQLVADIDTRSAQTADLLAIQGNAIFYGGEIVARAKAVLPGTYTVVTSTGLSLNELSSPSSLLFNWLVGYVNNQNITLTPQANFQPSGVSLNASEASLARYLSSAWNAADGHFAPVFGYLSQIGGSGGYKSSLGALSAESAQPLASALLTSEGALLGAALSCPVFVDQGTLLGEDECVWAKVTGSWTNQSQTSDTQGYNISGALYRIGGQHEVAPGWYMGGSLGAGQSWASADTGSSGSGQSYDGSVSLKHVAGPWLFAASVALANGDFQNTRVVQLPAMGTAPGISAALRSDSSLFLAGGRLRGGYEFAFSNWYIRPYLDLDLVYWDAPGYQETGTPGYALNVQGGSDTSFFISPMAELGGRINLDPETVLRPFATFGLSYTPDNTRVITSSFVGSAPGDGLFQSYVKTPSTLGLFTAGFDLYKANGFEVKAEYNLSGGSSYLSQGGSARLAYHF